LKLVERRFTALDAMLSGETAKAHDYLMQGYAERQKKSLGPYIENNSLFEGFSRAIPVYAQLGMVMEAVDISDNGMDAVIEVHHVCPFMDMAREYGFERPCPVICDLDIEATIEAFDGFKGKTISCKADGEEDSPGKAGHREDPGRGLRDHERRANAARMGEKNVSTDLIERLCYSRDLSVHETVPDVIVFVRKDRRG
jgi:hypothetical protein